MIFAWGSNNIGSRKTNLQEIQSRIKYTKLAFNYYNAKIHISSFYLPQYILNALDEN